MAEAVTTATPPLTAQTTNNFLTYVNAVNKITIKYPSTWTKTELEDNPSIPVIFKAPVTIAANTAQPNTGADTPKTIFMISMTPGAANLNSFAQQQINALAHSSTINYTITNMNTKVLTPPSGITAFHEISYDAMKNNVPTEVPLKGEGIFFVNGGTGYSLLYLAKQTDYTQNLPMIQQMVNSFQIGGSGASCGGPIQNVPVGSSSAPGKATTPSPLMKRVNGYVE